jgi:hypothetical protein
MDTAIRQRVFERDNYTCRYCGSKEGPFHADHVYPYSRGGETSINNMVTACARCNTKKSSKVGRWPMPLGYWDEHEAITKKAAHGIKEEGYLIFTSLIPSGLMLALFGYFPEPIWLWVKIPVIAWFGASLYCSGYWVLDFMRNEV